jgi:hypothetical protein
LKIAQQILKIFFLLIVAPDTWAQHKQVEQFINEIAFRDIIPAGHSYYYLLDTGNGIDPARSLEVFKALPYVQKKDSAFTAEVLEQFPVYDTNIISWSAYNLERCRVIPNHTGDSICANWRTVGMVKPKFYAKHKDSLKQAAAYNHIDAPVSRWWRKKRRMAVIAAYGDSLDLSIPIERKDYFRFSRPSFTRNGRYAMIWYGAGEHNYCLYIYRKEENGEWKMLTYIFCIC